MKVMVWSFVSGTHKVMTTFITVVFYSISQELPLLLFCYFAFFWWCLQQLHWSTMNVYTLTPVIFKFWWFGFCGMQLYDYQYNMGLLLLQRKTWTSQVDELKGTISDAHETLQREKAAHLLELSEALGRLESTQKALELEKQCVLDVSCQLSVIISISYSSKFLSNWWFAQQRNISIWCFCIWNLQRNYFKGFLSRSGELFETHFML